MTLLPLKIILFIQIYKSILKQFARGMLHQIDSIAYQLQNFFSLLPIYLHLGWLICLTACQHCIGNLMPKIDSFLWLGLVYLFNGMSALYR